MTLKMKKKKKTFFSFLEQGSRDSSPNTVKVALIWTLSLEIRERLSFVSNSRSLILYEYIKLPYNNVISIK